VGEKEEKRVARRRAEIAGRKDMVCEARRRNKNNRQTSVPIRKVDVKTDRL
jgi:hypothetical protein